MWRYPAYGGIEKVTTILANYFAEQLGWEVSIISHCGEHEDELLPELSPQVKLSIMPHGKNPAYPDNTTFLQQALALSRPDVLIFQDSYFNAVPLFHIDDDIPVIAVEHSTPDCYLKALAFECHTHPIDNAHDFVVFKCLFPYRWTKLYLKARQRHRFIYNLSDAYVMLSSRLFSSFKRITTLRHATKLKAINNPLTIQPSTNTEDKENICVFISQLVNEKGLDNLLHIWQLVERQENEWELVIVGDGPERTHIEDFIREQHVSRITLTGYQADVTPYLRKASVYLMTSIFEGWGLTLVEAMAMGCVPLAFNSYASARDIIDDGINGYLIKPFNIKAYAQKLLSLVQNPCLRQTMSQSTKRKSQEFSIEKIGPRWRQLIEDVIINHKSIER